MAAFVSFVLVLALDFPLCVEDENDYDVRLDTYEMSSAR